MATSLIEATGQGCTRSSQPWEGEGEVGNWRKSVKDDKLDLIRKVRFKTPSIVFC